MRYQEREISKESLGGHLKVLDSDEGVRIETKDGNFYVNRTARRYCVNESSNGQENFTFMDGLDQVLTFLAAKIGPESRIFSY